MELRAGLTAAVDLDVGELDTALALGSGDVPVLATPRILSLCEEACCRAVEACLEPGTTTVGMRVQLDHVAPVRVGSRVRAEATLERVESRRLNFTVSVSDPSGLVAAGRVTRVVVVRHEFLEKSR